MNKNTTNENIVGTIAYNEDHLTLEEAFRNRVNYEGLPVFAMLLQTERIDAGLQLLRRCIDEEDDKLRVSPSQLVGQIDLVRWAVAGINMALHAAANSADER